MHNMPEDQIAIAYFQSWEMFRNPEVKDPRIKLEAKEILDIVGKLLRIDSGEDSFQSFREGVIDKDPETIEDLVVIVWFSQGSSIWGLNAPQWKRKEAALETIITMLKRANQEIALDGRTSITWLNLIEPLIDTSHRREYLWQLLLWISQGLPSEDELEEDGDPLINLLASELDRYCQYISNTPPPYDCVIEVQYTSTAQGKRPYSLIYRRLPDPSDPMHPYINPIEVLPEENTNE